MITQDDMTNLVATTAGISKEKAKETVKALFTAIADEVALNADGVRLPELGKIRRNPIAASQGTNPRTGEKLNFPACYRGKFTASQALRDRLAALAPPVFAPDAKAAAE